MWTLEAAIRLVRPLNLLITAIGVIVGVVLARGGPGIHETAWAATGLAAGSAILIAAGGNAWNDILDREIDAVNRPDRPLPSGRISAGVARLLWVVLTLAGIVLAVAVSWLHCALAVLAALLLYVYSVYLKGMPLAGNLTVAFVVALAIVYGGLLGPALRNALVGAVFAFLTTFAREVVKDVEDVDGDRLAGIRTVPLVYGIGVARKVVTGALLLTVLLTPIPFLSMDYGPLFLLLVLFADLVLLRCVWLAPETPQEATVASTWLKSGMLIGMAALLAA